MNSQYTITTRATRLLLLAAMLFLVACTGGEQVTPTSPADLPTSTTGAATPTLAVTEAAVTPADTAAPTTTSEAAVTATAPAATTAPPTATTVPATVAPTTPADDATVPPFDTSYEELISPGSLLASFYNAINLGQYERAYSYLGENPTIPFDQFVQSYRDTARVTPVIIPPTVLEGAAGSVYAQVPTFLHITYPDNHQESRQGCLVVRAPSQEIGTAVWHIYEMELNPAPALTLDLPQLAQACSLPVIDTARPAYDRQFTPTNVLTSLYDAVNRQDYGRAYGYWQGLTTTPEEFAQGYADTEQVLVAVIPPSFMGAAAGSVYAEIPTFLVATHQDGTLHPFQGCYITRRSNQGTEADASWWIYSGDVQPATSANGFDVVALDATCMNDGS